MSDALLRALGWALLLSLGQGCAVALVYAFARYARGSSPAFKQAIAFGAQISLLILFALSTAALWRAWQPAHGDLVPRALPRLSGESTTAAFTSAAVNARPRLITALGRLDDGAGWIAAAWLTGIAIFLGRILARWRAARALVRAGRVRHDLTAMVNDIARQLDIRARVLTVQSAVPSPAMVGWRSPVILLPNDVDEVLAPEELRAVLAHELAHVRRHDYAQHVLQSIVSALLFFHPAVRWLNRCAQRAREEACDDLAVRLCRSPIVYARALERLESARAGLPRTAAALAVVDGELLTRIRRVVTNDVARHPRTRLATLFTPFLSLPVLLACALPIAVAPAVPVAVGRLHNAIYNVNAQDPAGSFTVTVLGDQVLGATVGGQLVPAAQLRQIDDELHFLNADGSTDFKIRVTSTGIHWSPRQPARPPS